MRPIHVTVSTWLSIFALILPTLATAQPVESDIVLMQSLGNALIAPVRNTPPDQELPIIEREVYRSIGDNLFHFNLYLEPSECPPGEVHQNCYSLVIADYWSWYNGTTTYLENEFYTIAIDRITTHRFTVSVYDEKGNLIFTITPDLLQDEVCVTVEGTVPEETLCLPIDPDRMPPSIEVLLPQQGMAGL